MSEIVYNIDARGADAGAVARLEDKLMNKPEITLKNLENGKFNIFVDGKPLPTRDITIKQEFAGLIIIDMQLVLKDIKLEGSD